VRFQKMYFKVSNYLWQVRQDVLTSSLKFWLMQHRLGLLVHTSIGHDCPLRIHNSLIDGDILILSASALVTADDVFLPEIYELRLESIKMTGKQGTRN
jgi:hypothetical protein